MIINGTIFTVGDKFAGFVITSIDKDGVTLKDKGGEEIKVDSLYSAVKSPTMKNGKGKSEKSN